MLAQAELFIINQCEHDAILGILILIRIMLEHSAINAGGSSQTKHVHMEGPFNQLMFRHGRVGRWDSPIVY
jgi:hypothetical protein